VLPDVAERCLTCRSAETRIAGRGLVWPRASGRWLPTWLPGISLATLMFECRYSFWLTDCESRCAVPRPGTAVEAEPARLPGSAVLRP